MKCPKCGAENHRVVETRVEPAYVMRYRLCRECGESFRTHERQVWAAGPNKWSTTPVTLEASE